jgi:hypothetical protein
MESCVGIQGNVVERGILTSCLVPANEGDDVPLNREDVLEICFGTFFSVLARGNVGRTSEAVGAGIDGWTGPKRRGCGIVGP